MKKAIVTGSTGFIGSVFVEFLISKGIEVLAIGRKELSVYSIYKQEKLKGANYLTLNLNDISSLPQKLIEMNWSVSDECVFFNLAWGGEKNLSDLNVQSQLYNVVWSVRALEIASQIGCSRFIHVGTMEEAFTEKYLELDFKRNSEYNRHVIYSVAKLAAKKALTLRAHQINMDFIYVLHSHVMGIEDDKDSFLQVTLKKLINEEDLIFSSGNQYFDVISTKDCALGYYLICCKGIPGEEYWVGSGNPRRLREYVQIMSELYPSGKKLQFGKLPYNDIVLQPDDFSIELLTLHTGYKPSMTYEQTVRELYNSFVHPETS
jgi:nucleoside-diphosphate-sugar epimerase